MIEAGFADKIITPAKINDFLLADYPVPLTFAA